MSWRLASSPFWYPQASLEDVYPGFMWVCLLQATSLLNEAEEAIDEEAFQARGLSQSKMVKSASNTSCSALHWGSWEGAILIYSKIWYDLMVWWVVLEERWVLPGVGVVVWIWIRICPYRLLCWCSPFNLRLHQMPSTSFERLVTELALPDRWDASLVPTRQRVELISQAPCFQILYASFNPLSIQARSSATWSQNTSLEKNQGFPPVFAHSF